jgi:serine/threonine protein kinase
VGFGHDLQEERPPRGVVKLLDMGLARTRIASGAASAGLTAHGAVLGTPDYLAPEQALNAKGVDIRADVYSLGCTLYHLLAGRPPFPGATVTEKLLKHQLHEPEPVEQWCLGLPNGLSDVVRKRMAKKPEHRYQSPTDVATALEAFAASGNSAGWTDSLPPDLVPTDPAPTALSVRNEGHTWDTKTNGVRGVATRRRDWGADLESSDPEQRSAALERIASRRLGQHLDRVLEILRHDPSAKARERAAWALDCLNDARAAPTLLKALDDPDWHVRSNAGWALVHLGSVVKGMVQQVAEESQNRDACEMARKVLARL